MTVRDLIRQLLDMPLDSEVLIETDEGGGECDIARVKFSEGRAKGNGWTHLVPVNDLTDAT